jgi:flagellar basal-body rod protein FlgB
MLHCLGYPKSLIAAMIDRIDSDTRVLQTALNVRAYRQELLASNMANADTPHYKARDIEFKDALASALGAPGGSIRMANTSPAHLQGLNANTFGTPLLYRKEQQSAVDGNTVNMDVERSAFADNALQVEALLTFVRGSFKDMNNAITG